MEGERMGVYTDTFQVSTKGETDIIDITGTVSKSVRKSGLSAGLVSVFVSGSTAGITTVEYEPGLVQDLREAYERTAPRNATYAHNNRWGDGNGYAHVRASLTGQELSVPFSNSSLMLGTWQQIILIDFDNRPRTRQVTVQVIGE
jgi:secondary thiamine-phosphate synthase enzyme